MRAAWGAHARGVRIDDHPETSAVVAGMPPVPVAKLVSRSYVRARLREATGVREVTDAAVCAAVEHLEREFAALLAASAERVQDERSLRAIHGLYESPALRVHHLEGSTAKARTPRASSGIAAASEPWR